MEPGPALKCLQLVTLSGCTFHDAVGIKYLFLLPRQQQKSPTLLFTFQQPRDFVCALSHQFPTARGYFVCTKPSISNCLGVFCVLQTRSTGIQHAFFPQNSCTWGPWLQNALNKHGMCNWTCAYAIIKQIQAWHCKHVVPVHKIFHFSCFYQV